MTAYRSLTAFAVANVLGLASANAATITMSPLPSAQAGTIATVTSCAADRAASYAGPAASDDRESRARWRSNGRLRASDEFVSCGNRWLDDAALATARTLHYRPEIRNCAECHLRRGRFADALSCLNEAAPLFDAVDFPGFVFAKLTAVSMRLSTHMLRPELAGYLDADRMLESCSRSGGAVHRRDGQRIRRIVCR